MRHCPPHWKTDNMYAGDIHVPHQTSGSSIPAVRPLHHQPQPVAYYCKVCEVKLTSYKNIKQHNNGRRHRIMLNLHEELERPRMPKEEIPNSQVNLAVQPETAVMSGNNECPEKNLSFEATVAMCSPDVLAEEKPRDKTRAQGHNLKRKFIGAKTGKYMKTNSGIRRPMESSKFDINYLSDSIDSPVQISALTPQPAVANDMMAPSPVVGSSFKHVYQHVLALQAEVLEAKKYHKIQNLTVETNGHQHVPADSNICTQPEDVSSDSAARVIGQPKVRYCKICDVYLPNCSIGLLEMHNKGKRHQRESKLKEEIQRQKISKGQIPNSQKNLIVQPKTAQISAKNKDQLKNMSSEGSISKHKNYQQKSMGLISEIRAKGPEVKPRDNSGAQGHGFKHRDRGTNTGKYIKTNDGVRRQMESSKLNINSLSKSAQCSIPALVPLPEPVASQIMAPTLVVGSSFEQQFQHVSASQTPVSEEKEHYEIRNPTSEMTDQPHSPTDSNINTPIEVMTSDSTAIKMSPSEGFMASQVCSPLLTVTSSFEPQIQHVLLTHVLESKEHHGIYNPTFETNNQPRSISPDLHTPVGFDINSRADVNSDTKEIEIGPPKMLTESNTFEVSVAVESNFESQIQHFLRNKTEPQLSKDTADCERQNCSEDKNNQMVPSVIVEFSSPPGSRTNTQTSDGCSKDEQKMDILTRQPGTTHLSQVAVCLTCGSGRFPHLLVFCNKCEVYALHRYCLDGPVIFTDDVIWFCEDCQPKVADTSCDDQCILLQSDENVSLKLANDVSQARIEPQNFREGIKNNKQETENIAAKTTVLSADDHSLSHHGLSQCRNNTEKENKFKKEYEPVPKDEANTIAGSMIVTIPRPIADPVCSNKTEKVNKLKKECEPVPKDEEYTLEGSMIVTVPHPILDPVWRGSLRLFDPRFGTAIGLLAHMSTLACSKVLEETKLFPDELCPDLLPRSKLWPKSFMKYGPKEDSIALYFFPDCESVERVFDKLVDDMIFSDLSLRAVVQNAELLIFPSTLLPIQCRRFQEKYFLWGVFKAKK